MHMWPYMDGGMMLGMALWWLLGALLILGLIVALFRLAGAPTQYRATLPEEPSGARRILDERFARGEIDEDEYRRRRKLLSD